MDIDSSCKKWLWRIASCSYGLMAYRTSFERMWILCFPWISYCRYFPKQPKGRRCYADMIWRIARDFRHGGEWDPLELCNVKSNAPWTGHVTFSKWIASAIAPLLQRLDIHSISFACLFFGGYINHLWPEGCPMKLTMLFSKLRDVTRHSIHPLGTFCKLMTVH